MKSIVTICLLLAVLYCNSPALAVPHYPSGVEGIQGATLPPPGFHYRMYNVWGDYQRNIDAKGKKVNGDFDLGVLANVHRLVYITDCKLWGADYGMSLVLPLTDVDLEVAVPGPGVVFDDSSSGLADLTIEPFVLAWHKPRYDLSLGLAVVVPSGHYSSNPSKLYNGNGYWSGLFTLGGTWYFDDKKSTSVSVLTRSLVHSKQEETHIRPGAEFVAEWGIGHTIKADDNLLLRPGIAGFAEWQVADDDGDAISEARARKFAAGPEINFFWLPPTLLQLNFRLLWEFEARDSAEGVQGVFTLTKSF